MFWEGLIGLYENKTKAFQVILRYCLDQEPLTWRDSLLTINTSTVSYSPSQSFHDYLSFTLESPGDLKPKIAIKNLPSESYLFFTEKWAWLFLESLHFILHFIFIDEVLLFPQSVSIPIRSFFYEFFLEGVCFQLICHFSGGGFMRKILTGQRTPQ